jgi:hypothetical protein
MVVFGTEDGRVFASDDGGESWVASADGLGRVACAVVDVSGRAGT